MQTILLLLIENIIINNNDLVLMAIKQRAKFEGWLKFELAHQLKMNYPNTMVEYHLGNGKHADIFSNNSLIELKTTNTNYKIQGVKAKTRPITKNINDIIIDIEKLRVLNQPGYIAFVMFPIDSLKYNTHIKKVEAKIPPNKGWEQKKIIKIKDGNNYIDVLIFVSRVK